MKIICTCFELRVRYDCRVTAMKLSPETLCVLGSRLLGLVFMYPGRGKYGQATSHTWTTKLVCYRLLVCDELASNRQ